MKATVEPTNSQTRNGVRVYEWGTTGIKCISVTSARMLLGSPHNLATWRENRIIDRAMFDPEEYTAQAAKGEEYLRRWLRDGTERETDSRQTAAELGTAIHQAIELDMDPLECAPNVAPYIRQYGHMRRTIDFDIVLQERQVWNLAAGYAGTLDALAVMNRRNYSVLVDWKSSKEVWLDYVMQVSAYLAGEFIGNDGVIDEEATRLLHSAKRGAIAKLAPDSWSWHEFELDPHVLRAWFGALSFARFVYENPEPTFVAEMKGMA